MLGIFRAAGGIAENNGVLSSPCPHLVSFGNDGK